MKLIPLKQWVTERAEHDHVATNTVYNRLAKGKMVKPQMVKKNARVIFVVIEGEQMICPTCCGKGVV